MSELRQGTCAPCADMPGTGAAAVFCAIRPGAPQLPYMAGIWTGDQRRCPHAQPCNARVAVMTMDFLARLWAERRAKELQRHQLRRLIAETRKATADLAPKFAAVKAIREARMRQDGATGFIMVQGSNK